MGRMVFDGSRNNNGDYDDMAVFGGITSLLGIGSGRLFWAFECVFLL